jgi:hypothetical protein
LRFFILRYPKLQDMGRLPREFGEEVSELAEVLLEEALSELRRLTRDDFMPGSQRKELNGANEEMAGFFGILFSGDHGREVLERYGFSLPGK